MYIVLQGSFVISVSSTLRSSPLDALMSLLNCCPVSICSLRALQTKYYESCALNFAHTFKFPQ